MNFGSGRASRVALDIGDSSVLALIASGGSGRLKLCGCYERPLPQGLVADGEITDVDLVARELRAFAAEHGLKRRTVNIAVGNQKVIVRNIDMPEMTQEELRSAIEFQASDYIPIPVDEVVLDFLVLGKRVTTNGAARQEVLLVAAQKAMISMFTAALRQAGFKIAGIDVTSLALVRALIPSPSFLADPSETQACCVIADVSTSVSTLVVVVGDLLKFSRTVNFSSDRFAQALMEPLGLPMEDAHSLVQRVGLAGPLKPDRELYADEIIGQTQDVLRGVAYELSNEIRRSLQYYEAQPEARPATELVLSGRGALVRNLAAHLQETLGLPVSIADPLGHFSENVSGLPDSVLAFMSPYLSTAVGLVLPEEE